jgi:hypothetical protein
MLIIDPESCLTGEMWSYVDWVDSDEEWLYGVLDACLKALNKSQCP